jgi:DNA-binding CsgD family transcriptional regulator
MIVAARPYANGAWTPLDQLTSREAQIARLAADGQSNPEIGARLFISPRTVESHLRNVFTKLNISSCMRRVSVPMWRLAIIRHWCRIGGRGGRVLTALGARVVTGLSVRASGG